MSQEPPAEVRVGPFRALHEAMWRHLDGDLEGAEAIFRQIRPEPAASIARRQLIHLLRIQHRYAEALEVLRAHAAVHPKDPEIAFYLAKSLLQLGQYEEGWRYYEARRATPGFAGPLGLSTPEWTGGPVKSLLVLDEQGLGDTIQFARFVPLLVVRGVQVTLICRPALVELFQGLGASVIPRSEQTPIPPHDAWALVGSLPLRLGVTLETLPSAPYLAAPRARRDAWSLPAGARFGVVTRGQPGNALDAARSLPFEAAAFAQSFPGAINLELGATPLKIRDMADTAAIVEKLERVISVCTAVAHLTGALRRPGAVLLSHDADWRWGIGGSRSAWYPSLTLYRQDAPGDWRGVLKRLRRDLSVEA